MSPAVTAGAPPRRKPHRPGWCPGNRLADMDALPVPVQQPLDHRRPATYGSNDNLAYQGCTGGVEQYFSWDGRDMMVGVRSTEAGWTDNVYRYRCLCQVDPGERGDFALSSISLL